jgi:hypothetical protein
MDAMKAAGMDYEQRMAELETLEWPKPNREFIYETFNAFADKHPWVGDDNIRPKSVAREMFETFCTFAEYVRDYGLQRSEGVLLRYLSDVWKTLSQTVPAPARTEGVEDIIAHLHAMLREVDSSLVDEWQSLKDGKTANAATRAQIAAREAKPIELADDPKALAARIRSDLHLLMRALAAKRWDEAAAALRVPGPDDTTAGEPWTAARLEQEMSPYFAAHATLSVTPLARRPSNTLIQEMGTRRWRAQQRLIDPEGDEDWAIDCVVDLSKPPSPGTAPVAKPPSSGTTPVADTTPPAGAPLIQLQRIGV